MQRIPWPLKQHYSVIATAAHPRRVIRESHYGVARSHHARIVLLMFRLDDALAKRRIREAARDSAILDISPHGAPTSFEQLYANQKKILEEPTPAELESIYRAYEVNKQNSDRVFAECLSLVRDASPAELA